MVPTAEEFWNELIKRENDFHMLSEIKDKRLLNHVFDAMKRFTEEHRQECLKQAATKAKKSFVEDKNTKGGGYYVVNKDSILNAYSKKNIR